MAFHPDISGGIMIIGGTVTGGTSPAVLFVGAGGVLAQDPADFGYDPTRNILLVNKIAQISGTDIAFGDSTTTVVNVYFGKGSTSATPAQSHLAGTGGSGTDIAGASINLAGGKATGNAYGGEVRIYTSDAGASGSALQSWTPNMVFSQTNKAAFAFGRIIETEGANVTAAATITLGTGNFFTVTGNTTIDNIVATNWNSAGPNVGGAQVTLLFTGTPTVRHNTAGTGARIFLAGSANLLAAANTILGLVWDGTQWQETFRKVA